ncbi:MAG TPA: LTA synthase family protein [Flavobacteriales bacterium]|nr:LTA synthase family protein [Flavobacteriales bacterium]
MARLRGPLLVLLLRFAVLLLIHTLLRILFVAMNGDGFGHVPIDAYFGGVRFDASAMAWLNMPWVLLCVISAKEIGWFARTKRILFHVGNAVAFFFACADLEYYKFTLKRSTADIFGIMAGGGDTGSLASTFLGDYWYIVLLFIGCIVLAESGYRLALRGAAGSPLSRTRQVVWRVVAIALVVVAARGGLQLMPLAVIDAGAYAEGAQVPVVLNTPFTIMMSIGKPVVEEMKYMSVDEADELWPVSHQYQHVDTIASPKVRTNVVVIILESFSAAYSAKLSHKDEGYMPFLDSLMDRSITCTRAFANGRRSIDGIPAITASIPELMDEAFITSNYAQSRFTSLANILGAEGYSTSFFHGGRNGTMGFAGFTKSAGYQRYVGMNEYNNEADYDGSWGIWDRPFLQFYAHELGKEKEPFLSTLFTLSSHHPYKLLPEDAARFKGGTHEIHPSLRYSDDALRQFFATASKQPWFDRTLFVITADHTADLDRTGQNYSEAIDYWVPLLYFMPKTIAPMEMDRVTQHIDILPTTLDLLGYSMSFFSFGSSALRNERAAVAVTHTTGGYLAIDTAGVLRFDGRTSDGTSEKKQRVLEAAIQQFNNRMLKNELTVK